MGRLEDEGGEGVQGRTANRRKGSSRTVGTIWKDIEVEGNRRYNILYKFCGKVLKYNERI